MQQDEKELRDYDDENNITQHVEARDQVHDEDDEENLIQVMQDPTLHNLARQKNATFWKRITLLSVSLLVFYSIAKTFACMAFGVVVPVVVYLLEMSITGIATAAGFLAMWRNSSLATGSMMGAVLVHAVLLLGAVFYLKLSLAFVALSVPDFVLSWIVFFSGLMNTIYMVLEQ